MVSPDSPKTKMLVLAGAIALTVGIHYGWLVEPFFGHVHWLHVIHGRFCYIPIVIAAAWFGLRGGLVVAGLISAAVLPYILGSDLPTTNLISEWVEIVFYFALGGLIGFLVDRELAARQRQQRAELQVERSQKLSLVGQIAAGVAHEIKNPLASIKGATDILTDPATSADDRTEFSDILRSEVRRIDATVTEFLEFARPKHTELRRIDLSEITRTCLRQIETQTRAAEVTLATAIRDRVIVNGDPEKLHQMMLNLLLNAIQASHPGQQIGVSLQLLPTADIVLTISDSGDGIARADLERVFEPFYTTRSSGTGLGLAVVKAIVDSHGGQIRIDSTPGRGTTMIVELPQWREGDR